jgi:exonuclease SbcD
MRFVHTSDWHLGRTLGGSSLVDDQAHVLEQVIEVTAEAGVDALIVAGDIYDRVIPPPEAVRLLDDTLARVALDLGVRVVLIAGNHDSPDRLGFGSRLLTTSGVHVAGRVAARPLTLPFGDEHGAVDVVALPYAEPAMVREALNDTDLRDHDRAFKALVETVTRARPEKRRTVLVAHVFAGGATTSESERPLSVGGSGAVDPRALDTFDYVALGHLHRPQSVLRDSVRYSGSPLKYSLSEAAHSKSVSVVELGAEGHCHIEEVSLTPRRELRRISGTLAEIIAAGGNDSARHDYVFAELADRGPVLDAMARIREVYPNCVELDRSAFFSQAVAEHAARTDLARSSERHAFAAFIEHVTGEAIRDEEAKSFAEIVDALTSTQRETGA